MKFVPYSVFYILSLNFQEFKLQENAIMFFILSFLCKFVLEYY